MKLFISFIVLVLSLWSQSVHAQQVDCSWPVDPECTEDWSDGSSMDLWLQVSSSPPCSVLVRVYYKQRCLQVEVQDFALGILQTNPSGCATPAQIYSFASSPAFKDQISIALSLQVTRRWLVMYPHKAPRCPDAERVTTSKFGSCRRPQVQYTFLDGSTTNVDYDPLQSWEYYSNLFSSTGGVMTSCVMVVCSYDICCFRNFTFCVDENRLIQWSMGAWTDVGVCPPWGPCIFKFCGDP